MDDLMANVDALQDVIQHRYAGWDASRLQAEPGERHLAIWPAPEAQTAEPLTIGAHRLRSAFGVLYWEHAGDDLALGQVDYEGAAAMLAIHDEVVGRLYAMVNQIIGDPDDPDSFKVWYDSSGLPEFAGTTRWFGVGFIVDRAKEFT